jgi:predicted alpha/beta hydrolase family esterase
LKGNNFIAISGFNNFIAGMDDFDRVNSKFFVEDGVLRAMRERFSKRICFVSESDPHLPFDVLTRFAFELGADVISVEDGGHFNEASGYTRFIEVEELLLKNNG